MRAVHAATGNRGLLREALPLLIVEHGYWTSPPRGMRVRAADGGGGGGERRWHALSRYVADWSQPRPESHAEDVALAEALLGPPPEPLEGADGAATRRAALFRDIASAAASGWDFSSRWCADGASLGTIRTTGIAPADLNGFLHGLESDLSAFAAALGDAGAAAHFAAAAAARRAAMEELMWDAAAGCWRDVLLAPCGGGGGGGGGGDGDGGGADFVAAGFVEGTFASGWVPLWCGVAGDAARGAACAASLEASGLVGPGGVAASLATTGQQWDAPNAWPPLQHMLIEGLGAHGGPAGAALARRLAGEWVRGCAAGHASSGHMHEKYDARGGRGAAGGGGEYAPQVGFGWSNGVALHLLARYGDELAGDGDGGGGEGDGAPG